MATPGGMMAGTPGGMASGTGAGGNVQRLPPEVNRILYVRNLPFNISAEELYKIFGDYGAIRQIRTCASLLGPELLGSRLVPAPCLVLRACLAPDTRAQP
jgi:RNA recognition motif-containing protein